jgi:hypothetical protein
MTFREGDIVRVPGERDVYLKARVTVKATICVDGKQIGGDTF